MGLYLFWASRVSQVIGFRSGLPAPCSLLYAALYTGRGALSFPGFVLASIKGIRMGKGACCPMKIGGHIL
jgi:hypothetical protein